MPSVVKINQKFIWIFLGSLIVAVISILSFDSALISYAFSGICIVLLLINAILKRWDNYLILFLVFFGLSLEYAAFVGGDNFYSIKNIRIAGLNLGIWMLLPIWIGLVFSKPNLMRIKKDYNSFWRAGIGLLIINFIAAIMGLLMLVFNDNEVLSTNGWLSSYIEIFYMHTLIPFSIFACLIMILQQKDGITRIVFKGTMAMQACLWGVVFQLIVSRALNIYGNYDGLNTLMTSAISTYLPFMLMLSFYKRNTYFRMINLVLALVGLLLIVIFNAGGKLFISLFLVMIILYFYFMNQRNAMMKVISTMLVIIGALGAAFLISNLANRNNVLLGSKLSQTLSMVQFWKPNWLENMDMSPRLRFAEFANLFIEYVHKPWLILTGKGFGGTIKDHTGFFFLVPQYMMESGFSAKQWENKLFYELHEIVSSLLIYGFLWIVFFIKTVKRTLKSYKTFPWFVMGVYWILVYYGYSFTITIFGAIAYFIGALEIDEEVCELRTLNR